MLKFLGIVLAVIAASSIGLYKADELKQRRRQLNDFQHLLMEISTEIGYFKEPLPKIFEKLSCGEDESRILLRTCLLEYYHTENKMNVIWKKAAEEVYHIPPLTQEDIDIIKKCGEFLGQSDLKGQEEHIKLTLDRLSRQLAESEEIIKTKGKLYGKLGLAAGLAIAVMLI